MNVYLVRHGIAVDVGTNDVTRDQDRMLSEEGQRRTHDAARGIKELCSQGPRIISSPLIRAYETAEIIADVLNTDQKVEICFDLSPDGSMPRLLEWLETQGPDPIMLVGHMPDMSMLASIFLSGDTELHIQFKKAACCCISFPGAIQVGQGGLEWLIQPKALRAITSRSAVG